MENTRLFVRYKSYYLRGVTLSHMYKPLFYRNRFWAESTFPLSVLINAVCRDTRLTRQGLWQDEVKQESRGHLVPAVLRLSCCCHLGQNSYPLWLGTRKLKRHQLSIDSSAAISHELHINLEERGKQEARGGT